MTNKNGGVVRLKDLTHILIIKTKEEFTYGKDNIQKNT